MTTTMKTFQLGDEVHIKGESQWASRAWTVVKINRTTYGLQDAAGTNLRCSPEYMTAPSAKLRLKGERRAKLNDRAKKLAAKYLPELDGVDFTLTYRQVESVWGSCNPQKCTITIADACRQQPRYFEDYVIVHELVHLIHDNHGSEFWELVNRYPKTSKALDHAKLED